MTTDLPDTEQALDAPQPPPEGGHVTAEDSWRPRPVRLGWLIGVSAALAAFLAISIWLGAFTPRIQEYEQGVKSIGARRERQFSITNDAVTALRLEGAGPPAGSELISAIVIPGDGTTKDARTRPVGDLAQGDTMSVGPNVRVRLLVTYRVTDCRAEHRHPAIPLHTRTALGVRRTVHLGDEPATWARSWDVACRP